jgi:hypothetical protein
MSRSSLCRSSYKLLLLVAAGLAICTPCVAGFPWSRSNTANTKRTVYAPQVRHYAVVSPVEVAGTHGVYGGNVLWDETRPQTPVYPWGWFGSRTSPQPWAHSGFYNNYRDHGIIREQ